MHVLREDLLISALWQWLFPVRQVSFELNEGATEVAERLRRRISQPAFSNLFIEGVVGTVSTDGVRLKYQTGRNRLNHLGPVFAGQFVQEAGRSRLSGRFVVPLLTQAFFGCWLGFVLLWWVGATLITLSGHSGIPLILALAAPPAMIGFGIAVVVLRQRTGVSEREITGVVQAAIDDRTA
jgi:hypothetical protein